MQRMPLVLALAAIVLGAVACSGPNSAKNVPVSSPVYTFEAPDAEDFDVESDDDEPAADDTSDADQGE